jgi:hypothetical protein
MIMDGIALGTLTFGVGWFMWKKLPARIKKLLLRFDLVMEFGAAALTFWLHGDTLAGITASVWVGVMVAIAIHVGKNRQDFQWLFDAYEEASKFAGQFMSWIKDCVRSGRPAPLGVDVVTPIGLVPSMA